jgi:hypothetical protein
MRNGIHLRPGGTVLVRRGSCTAADAARRRRLPVPGLLAEDGGGGNFKQPCILKVYRRHCEERSDEAIQPCFAVLWIASRSLSSGAHRATRWLAMTCELSRPARRRLLRAACRSAPRESFGNRRRLRAVPSSPQLMSPLLGAKQTSGRRSDISVFDPQRASPGDAATAV